MNRKKLYTLRALLPVTLVLVLVLSALAGTVLAQSSDADQPEALTDDKPVSVPLVGNAAGSFAYYAIDYPGDDSVITITVDAAPSDPVTRKGVGFNVYGPDGTLIAERNPDEGGRAELEYGDTTETDWLVQVYNYIPDQEIQFTIEMTGLTEAEAEAAPEPETPVVPEEEAVAESPLPVSGNLYGVASGDFDLYTLSFAGEEDVTLTLNFVGDNPIIGDGIGMIVYDADGEVARTGSAGDEPGQRELTFTAEPGVQYTLQVYNYIFDLPTVYTVTD